jgi:predicted NUDIX family NTP pyrophosphohydrolase
MGQLSFRQATGRKIVHIWAIEGDWDAGELRSNQFEMERQPRSGQLQKFPELDRAAWFSIAEARKRILTGQAVFLERLIDGRLFKSMFAFPRE